MPEQLGCSNVIQMFGVSEARHAGKILGEY